MSNSSWELFVWNTKPNICIQLVHNTLIPQNGLRNVFMHIYIPVPELDKPKSSLRVSTRMFTSRAQVIANFVERGTQDPSMRFPLPPSIIASVPRIRPPPVGRLIPVPIIPPRRRWRPSASIPRIVPPPIVPTIFLLPDRWRRRSRTNMSRPRRRGQR